MRQILLHVEPDEKIFAALDDGILNDLEIERNNNLDIVGRVYKGIVRNSVPSINGYFIDIGIGRNAFLRKRDLPADTNITEGSTAGRKRQHGNKKPLSDRQNRHTGQVFCYACK